MARLHGNRSLLQITIDAVTSLLDTLNENDRVGVIVFDTGTVVPGVSIRKCVGTKLVKASIENIRFYQNIIQQIQTGARCNYELALRDAFQFFRNSNYSFRGEKREQVILFLSDGLPTIGGDPVKVIAEENKILKNKVAVFTYAIGQSWNLTSLSVLRNMAWQVYSYPEYGEIKKGTFKHVVDPTKLKDEIGFYYREFVSKENDVATIIFKQYKHLQKAYMPYMFVCKQLHDTNYTVFGVTCLEMSLTSFLREPVIFYNEQHSYAFMIDGKGRTILHSSLSKASSLEADEEFTSIGFFENDKGPVVESMKRYV
ncbi:VWFA and cache domain-containing protein 1 [Magallana gigas]|uniref:VWFA and cache domain-containing protein 1 n=1 Tax=Magallana gigas TaxID=29159 RepID=UPI00333FB44C